MSHFLFHPQNQDIRNLIGILCIFITVLHRRFYLNVFLLALILAISFFFRDPVCKSRILFPRRILTCPTYGKVTHVFTGSKTHRISIFLSVFDPHAQYAPCDGTIRDVNYIPGTFHPAQLYSKTRGNERCITTIMTHDGQTIRVTQIAGFIARRILRFCQVGDQLLRAQPYGMIRFGSRVDIEIPSCYKVLIQEGQYVFGPYTPLAE